MVQKTIMRSEFHCEGIPSKSWEKTQLYPHLKEWTDVLLSNVFVEIKAQEILPLIVGHMLYCIKTNTLFNFVYFIARKLSGLDYNNEALPYNRVMTTILEYLKNKHLKDASRMIEVEEVTPMCPPYTMKSLDLKARKVSSDEEESCSGSDEEYAMAVRDFKKFFRRRGKFVRLSHDDKKNFRQIKEEKKGGDRRCFKCGDPNHFISDCPKHSFNDQNAFVGGCWSESDEEEDSKKDEICLMVLDNKEVLSDPPYYSSSSLDSESLQNEYNMLCKISLRIINKNKHLKAKNELLNNEACALNENGVVSINKARLVAQGYNQQEGIDFDETYALVARLESIRILIVYVCSHDFKLFHMGVKSAFLNGFINKEVYVTQPPSFVDFKKPNHVFKLKKALYGLKQSPKARYDRLKAFLLNHKYTIGLVDNTLFTKKRYSHIIIVKIYVDNIIFGSTCQDLCDGFSIIMHDEFEMIMMGELNFFFGLQIKQLEDGIFFNQSKYIKEMLKKFGLEDSKPIKTPMSSETKLTQDEDEESVDDTKYRGMIGFIGLSKNLVLHSRTKHIEIRHHCLRDNVQKGNILIEKVSSEDNIADILTKPLKREPVNLLRLGLSLMEQNA
nr:retrovirus-related Pol polyprotein from transposon TNT 1-94 [Tanacetum cinerariifolium]